MIVRFDSKRKSESGMHCFNSLQFLHHFSLTNLKLKAAVEPKTLTEIIHAEQK